MSQANDLLNSLTVDEMSKYSISPANEGHIVIGQDRFITVPESLKRIAVQFDHDVETVTFDCPRYWDGLDMSKMAVYINYILASGLNGSYMAQNVRVNPNDQSVMHFDWTVSRNITEVAGTITFLVCVKNTDSEGNEKNHWNSELNKDMYVSKGLETNEVVIDPYPDLITQLLLRMSTVEQINVQADEMQQLYENAQAAAAAAEESKNFALDESNYIKNSYANAYKATAKGDLVQIDKVCPLEHDIKCKVHGKNLANLNNIIRILSADISYTEPELVIRKTNDSEKWTNIYIGLGVYRDFVGKTLTMSLENMGEYAWNMLIVGTNNKGELVKEIGGSSARNGYMKFTVTVPEMPDAELLAIRMVSGDNLVTTGEEYTLRNIQVEEGSTATEYEPYIDPSTVVVTAGGKNFADISVVVTDDQNQVINKGNGTIVVNTTATSSAVPIASVTLKRLAAHLKAGSVYTLSAISTGTQKKIWLQEADYAWDFGTSAIITQQMLDSHVFVYASGNSTSATISNIQIESGEEPTEYEMYKGFDSYTPSTDGLVNAASISPIMTIFADTPGVIIEAEYNLDNNKVIGDINTALETIIGIQNSLLGGDA